MDLFLYILLKLKLAVEILTIIMQTLSQNLNLFILPITTKEIIKYKLILETKNN